MRKRVSGVAPETGDRMNTSYILRLVRIGHIGGDAIGSVFRWVSEKFLRMPRFALATGALLGGGSFATPALAASDRWETLQAIHLIENPTNSTRVGKAGELGPYQFRPATWKMHTKKPFHLAADRAEADAVAIKHYEWIKAQFERNGIEATPYRIALAWNAGVSATLQGRLPQRSYAYAARVDALTEDLKRRQIASGQ